MMPSLSTPAESVFPSQKAGPAPRKRCAQAPEAGDESQHTDFRQTLDQAAAEQKTSEKATSSSSGEQEPAPDKEPTETDPGAGESATVTPAHPRTETSFSPVVASAAADHMEGAGDATAPSPAVATADAPDDTLVIKPVDSETGLTGVQDTTVETAQEMITKNRQPAGKPSAASQLPTASAEDSKGIVQEPSRPSVVNGRPATAPQATPDDSPMGSASMTAENAGTARIAAPSSNTISPETAVSSTMTGASELQTKPSGTAPPVSAEPDPAANVDAAETDIAELKHLAARSGNTAADGQGGSGEQPAPQRNSGSEVRSPIDRPNAVDPAAESVAEDAMSTIRTESRTESPDAQIRPRGNDRPPSRIAADSVNDMVEKAVWSVRNGQSEVRIALKPDHLGHVRMLIATEQQHVNIRILTDAPIARDILESHISQLKTDLEQRGLRVEQMDVLYSGDDNQTGGHQQARERGGQRMPKRFAYVGQEADGTDLDPQAEAVPQPSHRGSEQGIDYFA